MAGVLVAADQLSTGWAEDVLTSRGPRQVLGRAVVLRHGANRGIAFGLGRDHLLPHKALWLTLYSAVITGVRAVVLVGRAVRPGSQRARPGRPAITVGLTALLAGAAGNLWDRASRGYVVDFIDIGVGEARWPTFNLADVYLGAGLLICLGGLWRATVVERRTSTE